jgi:hypothetical protein
MTRQRKDRSSKPRKAPAARGVEAPPVERTTGAPLIIAIILIAAIVLGLGYSVFKRSHEPTGIALPAAAPMDSTLAPAGAPADSAQPEKAVSYGANTLIN